MIALKGFEEGQKPNFMVGNLSCMEDVALFEKVKDRCEQTQLLMLFCTFPTPRSMLGGPPSYSNHDSNPNARLISKSNARVQIQVSLSSEEKCLLFSHILQVLRPIKAGEEITVRWDKDEILPPLRLHKSKPLLGTL